MVRGLIDNKPNKIEEHFLKQQVNNSLPYLGI